MKVSFAPLLTLPFSLLLAGCKPPASPSGSGSPATKTNSTFTVTGLLAERAGDHLHTKVTVRVRNPGTAALSLSPPAVQLLAGTKPVEPFIAPGLEPAVIPAGGEAEAATHWWVAAGDLSGALTLEIGGARTEVKSGSAFALDALPEKRAVALSFPDWKVQ